MLMPVQPVPIGKHGKPVFVRVAAKPRGFNTDFTQKRFRVGKGLLRQGYLKGSNARPQDINRPRRALLGWRSPVALRNRVFPLPRSIVAGGLGVLDDFETGDISGYSGGTAYFAPYGYGKYEGNYGLVYDSVDSFERIYRTDLTLSQGNTYTCWIASSDITNGYTGYMGFLFGVQDANNYYFAGFDNTASRLCLRKYASGWTVINAVAVTVPDSTWMLLTLSWGASGVMTLDWDQGAEQASGTENAWASGGFGFGVAADDVDECEVFWDYFVEL